LWGVGAGWCPPPCVVGAATLRVIACVVARLRAASPRVRAASRPRLLGGVRGSVHRSFVSLLRGSWRSVVAAIVRRRGRGCPGRGGGRGVGCGRVGWLLDRSRRSWGGGRGSGCGGGARRWWS